MAVPRKQNRVLLTNSRKSGTFSLIYIYISFHEIIQSRNNTIVVRYLARRTRTILKWKRHSWPIEEKPGPEINFQYNACLALFPDYDLIVASSRSTVYAIRANDIRTHAYMYIYIYISFYTLGGTLPYVAEALLCRILTTLLPLARRTRLWKSSHRTHVARNDGVWR